jgi:apolipoprotein N-acyltransferase
MTLVRSRYPLAILAGLLLAASFPKIGIAGFAWIAPGLMLAATLGKRGGESFRLGYAAGLAHYLASLYWLLLIPVTGFPVLGWVTLSAFVALYPATWVWLVFRISDFNLQISDTESNWLAAIEQMSSWGWSRRTFWAMTGAAIWVALEMIIARLLGGFPWNLLGVSQFQLVPLIQIASVTGVYGISFLLVWVSLSLIGAVSSIIFKPALRSAWLGEIILPLVAVAALFVFGFHRLSQSEPPSRELNVTLVQPSIPQTLIWDASENTNRFRQLIELSERALAEKTDLLVWPEAALPSFDEESFTAITNLIRKHRVWMIFGADDAEERPHATGSNKYDYYNAAFLFNPEGHYAAVYRKQNLVIFGEYIPLARWLPFLKLFTPIEGGFTPGDRAVPFELSDLKVKTSVLICFEDIFPHLARGYATDDTDFLVNLTNDGWFGEGAAQWQQAAAAIFRTVENGLPLVRCANTGLTGWADGHGRLRRIFADKNGSVYGAGFMAVKIPLLAAGEKRPRTFYNQHGDWFGWACMGFAAMTLIRNAVRRKGEQSRL